MNKNEVLQKIEEKYPKIFNLMNKEKFEIMRLYRTTRIDWRENSELVMYLNDQKTENEIVITQPKKPESSEQFRRIEQMFNDLIYRNQIIDSPSLLICLYMNKDESCKSTLVYTIEDDSPVFRYIRLRLKHNLRNLQEEWKKVEDFISPLKERLSREHYNDYIKSLLISKEEIS